MPKKSNKKKVKSLEVAMKQCNIASPENKSNEVVLNEQIDVKLLSLWPKLKKVVPTIFLHKAVNFAEHLKKLLLLGIKFYQPYLGTNYTRIFCHTYDDHRDMVQYLTRCQLPFHTFGHPNKRKMRIVIKGLSNDINLIILKQELKLAGIPIIRVHLMRMKDFVKKEQALVLAVVPYDDEGKKLLRVNKIFGQEVTLEPAKNKTKQCHLCQKWGHSQRYCHGEIKCVKCAGDHLSKKCTRQPEKEPPTCANCGGNHTASYRGCICCPDSDEYKNNQRNRVRRIQLPCSQRERSLVTLENYQILYKKIKNVPKHKEAIPF